MAIFSNPVSLFVMLSGIFILAIGAIVFAFLEENKETRAKRAAQDRVKFLENMLEDARLAQSETVTKIQQIEHSKAEAEKTRADLQFKESALASKEQKAQTFNTELSRAQEEHRAAQIKEEAELMRLKEENAEKQIQVARLEQQIQAARLEQQMRRLREEAEKIMADSQLKPEALSVKERQVEGLNAELGRLRDEHKVLQVKAESEIQRIRGEVDKIKIDSQAKSGELSKDLLVKQKEIERLAAELARVNNERGAFEEVSAKLKQAEPDINEIEVFLNEEKKALHKLKLRSQETKMKFQLLNDKSKESVELIAQFAQGKEFDEFRKSIHLDDIAQKYEEQIADLKTKNMQLHKSLQERG